MSWLFNRPVPRPEGMFDLQANARAALELVQTRGAQVQQGQFKFEFGDKVRDTVTGFEGTVTARYEYINGCRRYYVEALVKELPKGFTFDEEVLETTGAAKLEVAAEPSGGPRDTPPRTGH